jgi:MtN3 and saliva related transmembrane protein
MNIEIITGITAGIFTGISLVPQLIKIIKEKDGEDISVAMLVILLIGLMLWVCYGILKKDYPIIITNGFSFIVNLAIIWLRFYFKSNT